MDNLDNKYFERTISALKQADQARLIIVDEKFKASLRSKLQQRAIDMAKVEKFSFVKFFTSYRYIFGTVPVVAGVILVAVVALNHSVNLDKDLLSNDILNIEQDKFEPKPFVEKTQHVKEKKLVTFSSESIMPPPEILAKVRNSQNVVINSESNFLEAEIIPAQLSNVLYESDSLDVVTVPDYSNQQGNSVIKSIEPVETNNSNFTKNNVLDDSPKENFEHESYIYSKREGKFSFIPDRKIVKSNFDESVRQAVDFSVSSDVNEEQVDIETDVYSPTPNVVTDIGSNNSVNIDNADIRSDATVDNDTVDVDNNTVTTNFDDEKIENKNFRVFSHSLNVPQKLVNEDFKRLENKNLTSVTTVKSTNKLSLLDNQSLLPERIYFDGQSREQILHVVIQALEDRNGNLSRDYYVNIVIFPDETYGVTLYENGKASSLLLFVEKKPGEYSLVSRVDY